VGVASTAPSGDASGDASDDASDNGLAVSGAITFTIAAPWQGGIARSDACTLADTIAAMVCAAMSAHAQLRKGTSAISRHNTPIRQMALRRGWALTGVLEIRKRRVVAAVCMTPV
jgi:hypothetical protein